MTYSAFVAAAFKLLWVFFKFSGDGWWNRWRHQVPQRQPISGCLLSFEPNSTIPKGTFASTGFAVVSLSLFYRRGQQTTSSSSCALDYRFLFTSDFGHFRFPFSRFLVGFRSSQDSFWIVQHKCKCLCSIFFSAAYDSIRWSELVSNAASLRLYIHLQNGSSLDFAEFIFIISFCCMLDAGSSFSFVVASLKYVWSIHVRFHVSVEFFSRFFLATRPVSLLLVILWPPPPPF